MSNEHVYNALLSKGGHIDLPSFCRAWREEQGYTQTYIGMRGGVTRSTISRFEAGDIHSNKALYGYLSLGIQIPYDLITEYLKGSDTEWQRKNQKMLNGGGKQRLKIAL